MVPTSCAAARVVLSSLGTPTFQCFVRFSRLIQASSGSYTAAAMKSPPLSHQMLFRQIGWSWNSWFTGNNQLTTATYHDRGNLYQQWETLIIKCFRGNLNHLWAKRLGYKQLLKTKDLCIKNLLSWVLLAWWVGGLVGATSSCWCGWSCSS